MAMVREDRWQVDGFYSIPYVGDLIAKAIGATGKRTIPQGSAVPWSDAYMGGSGYVIATEDGRVFLDATRERDTIYLSQISVEHPGRGLGTRVMEALRDVAAQQGCGIVVYKVTNHDFFARFDWLARAEGGDWKADAGTLAERCEPAPRRM